MEENEVKPNLSEIENSEIAQTEIEKSEVPETEIVQATAVVDEVAVVEDETEIVQPTAVVDEVAVVEDDVQIDNVIKDEPAVENNVISNNSKTALPVSDEPPVGEETTDALPSAVEDETVEETEHEPVAQQEGTEQGGEVAPQEEETKLPEVEYDEESVEEEEEYEEEAEDEEGNTHIVLKKRIVRVKRRRERPKVEAPGEGETIDVTVEEGTEPTEAAADVLKEEGEKTDVEEEEYEEEEEEEAEEEEWIEEEEAKEEIGGEEGEVKVKKRRRKKKISDTTEVVEGEEGEEQVTPKKRKKKKKRKKSTVKEEGEIEGAAEEIEAPESPHEDTKSVTSKKSITESFKEEEAERQLTPEEQELKDLRETYMAVAIEQRQLKFKVMFFEKRLVKYFRSKKIDHAIIETTEDSEADNRYWKKIFQYDEAQKEMLEEKSSITAKWDQAKEQSLNDKEKLETALEEVKVQKQSIGARLVDVRTGKSVSAKILEELESRYVSLIHQMKHVRLIFIKLKNSVIMKKAEIKTDHMGADFHLMDYEQLCMQKEEYGDRIIDRDMDLKKVKQKAKDVQDFVDHMKAMCDRLQPKIQDESIMLQQLDLYMVEARETLNSLKDRRHYTLEDTIKMKQKSGLLTHPALLYDYEDTVKAVVETRQQLEMLRNTFTRQQDNIHRLRRLTSALPLS